MRTKDMSLLNISRQKIIINVIHFSIIFGTFLQNTSFRFLKIFFLRWWFVVNQKYELFLVFLLLMCPLCVPNERWSVLAAGSKCLEPNSGGVIRETGRSIWLHDCHCLMIMGCNSTLLWSTNHTGLAWTALNANEPWLEYWAAARPRGSTPFAPRGTRHMIMAVTLHHLQHCH